MAPGASGGGLRVTTVSARMGDLLWMIRWAEIHLGYAARRTLMLALRDCPVSGDADVSTRMMSIRRGWRGLAPVPPSAPSLGSSELAGAGARVPLRATRVTAVRTALLAHSHRLVSARRSCRTVGRPSKFGPAVPLRGVRR